MNPKFVSVLMLACFAVAVGVQRSEAQRKVMVIGDSLSREYQFEFPGFPDARNWVELLAVHRAGDIDFGPLEELNLSLFEPFCGLFGGDFCDAIGDGEDDLERYRYNWAIPTFTADAYRDNLTGTGTTDDLWQALIEPDFEEVDTVVIFLGGNDIDSVYGSIYNGSSSAAADMRDDIFKDLRAIVNYVQDENSALEIVLVNVPHVGATPEVKGDHPTNSTRTGRVTTALNLLNGDLEALAAAEGIAYADIATLTIDLVEPDTYCIGGIEFFNAGTDTGADEFLWLGGSSSQNFHPNTAGQALVADAILEALNETYGAGIARIGTREILETYLGMDADMPFTDWADGFGLGNGSDGFLDDPDGDGYPNLLEFALDGNPAAAGGSLTGNPQVNGTTLSLSFTPRDMDCEYVRIVAEQSADLQNWTDAPAPVDNGDGTFTATTAEQFLRLRVELVE